MDIEAIKTGMVVECRRSVGKVLAVDKAMGTVLLEEQSTQHQYTATVDDVESHPQLHNGCEKYY